MDRQQLLAQPDVAEFITWLRNNLPHLPVHLKFSSSRFVMHGIDHTSDVTGASPAVSQ